MMDDFQSQFCRAHCNTNRVPRALKSTDQNWSIRSNRRTGYGPKNLGPIRTLHVSKLTQKALYLFKNRKNPVYINNLLIIIGISRCECQIDFDGRHSKLYLTQKCQKDATRHGSNHMLRFRYTQSYIQCTFYPMWLVLAPSVIFQAFPNCQNLDFL